MVVLLAVQVHSKREP